MAEHRLLTTEREDRILQLLVQSRVMTVAEISAALSVSEATVRRDLQSMHERKLLQRVRGGATVATTKRIEPLFSDKESQHGDAKRAIAKAAPELIEDHDTIYLDGGSTLLELARLLDRFEALTIVTNSIMAAACLMTSSHRLILVGGEFRALSRTLVGPLTEPIIDTLNVDKAFMGTIGFSIPDGMTTTDPSEAFTKERILRRANQVVLLADSSKLGVPSFARSGSVQDVDTLVTEAIDPQFQRDLESQGVRVLLTQY